MAEEWINDWNTFTVRHTTNVIGRRLTCKCLVPTEILFYVFDLLACDRDGAHSISERKRDRAHLMLAGRRIAAICREVPSLWTNIVVQQNSTEYAVRNTLALAKQHSLHIVFQLAIETSEASTGNKIWAALTNPTIRERWYALYHIGVRRCSDSQLCTHAVFAGKDLLLTAPNVRVLKLRFQPSGERCRVHHPPVHIAVSALESLDCCVAFQRQVVLTDREPTEAPLPTLTYLDILIEDYGTCTQLIGLCSKLETLVWRPKRFAGSPGAVK
jgi:hypothetical protein